jgi:phosphoribosylformylglycinamidine (FGAM) synthase-like enzyme
MFNAAHDVSDGGIMQSLIEMALRGNVGARIWVPDNLDPFVFAYSESTTRAVVVVARDEESRFAKMCEARGFTATRIGVVDSGLDIDAISSTTEDGEDVVPAQMLQLDNVWGSSVRWTLDELREASTCTLPAVLNT